MKLCTDHLQTCTFFYHWTPHHSTDRYHQFFPMDETPHCYTNTLFTTFFTEKCKPMTSNLGAPTKDLPVQFYTKGMKDRLIKMIYHPLPHRILLKFPMRSCRPHIFWLTFFLPSFSLPCPLVPLHPLLPCQKPSQKPPPMLNVLTMLQGSINATTKSVSRRSSIRFLLPMLSGILR